MGDLINVANEGINEKGIDKNTGEIIVEVDSYYFRPTDVENLLGDPTKANKILGWKPSKSFNELVKLMVENDMNVIS